MTEIEQQSLKLVLDILIGQRRIAKFHQQIQDQLKVSEYQKAADIKEEMNKFMETLPNLEQLEHFRKRLDEPIKSEDNPY